MQFAEKIKRIRQTNQLTQEQFADSVGVSRENLANIEGGRVAPTSVFINCIALTYQVDKAWLLDDNNDDLSPLDGSTNLTTMIVDRYKLLDPPFKKYVEKQIAELLALQGELKGLN